MQLKALANITGHKSISTMTDEELRDHILTIRRSRATSKASDAKRSEKPDKPATKSRKKKVDLSQFSQADLEALLKQLGG